MEPQPEVLKTVVEQPTCPLQGLRVISEQDQIIHVAQTVLDAWKGPKLVIEGVEMKIGQELAGEAADRQAAGALQGSEQGVPGKESMAGPNVAPFWRRSQGEAWVRES